MGKAYVYTKGKRLDFGKYKGMQVEEVLAKNPSYIKWCLDNIEWFEATDEVKEYMEKSIEEEERHRYEDYIDLYQFCF